MKKEKSWIKVLDNASELHETTVSDIMVETMINRDVNAVFGMVGHSNLGLVAAFANSCGALGLKADVSLL